MNMLLKTGSDLKSIDMVKIAVRYSCGCVHFDLLKRTTRTTRIKVYNGSLETPELLR